MLSRTGIRIPSAGRPGPAAAAAVARLCAWGIVLVALTASWQLGAFTIHRGEGTGPDTFASVDHPFHVARAEALRRSLLDGEILRWVGNHQGGYPAEFYPFGFAYGVVGLWFALLGQVPLATVHKLAIVSVFLAPALAYWWMARRDRWTPAVALAAFALHVSIPGGPWHGGSNELIAMGLAPNVAAALLALLSFAAMHAAVSTGNAQAAAWAALASAAALWCNPRSAIALVASAAGVWIATLVSRGGGRPARRAALWIAGISATAALLAAPQVIALLRFGHLYHFVKYTSYASSLEYVSSAIAAVSWPVWVLALVGLVGPVRHGRTRPVTTAVALTLLVYVCVTLALSFVPWSMELVRQLETTRLMPFQRLLTIYLAAVGLAVAARAAADRWLEPGPARSGVTRVGVAVMVTGSLIATLLLPRVERGTDPAMRSLESAIHAAAAGSQPDTAILIVGSASSSHQQLWAPMVTDRPMFYDSWIWYWHTQHVGPYDPHRAAWYEPDQIRRLFSHEYLHRHGIGAVITTGAAGESAATSSSLGRLHEGIYTSYAVREVQPIITIGTRAPEAASIANHTVTAEAIGSGDDAVIVRRNWFPRWTAVVNGRPAPVERTQDGYMSVRLPRGPVSVALRYQLDAWDWTARVAAALGLVVVGSLLTCRRWRKKNPRER